MELITKEIISEIPNIKIVREEFRSWIEKIGVDESTVVDMDIVISETLANVLEHGIKQDEKKIIKIMYKFADNMVEFIISYEGEIIDKEKLKKCLKPPIPQNIEELMDGGRGIYMIHSIMDFVEYRKEKNVAKIIMKKKIKN